MIISEAVTEMQKLLERASGLIQMLDDEIDFRDAHLWLCEYRQFLEEYE